MITFTVVLCLTMLVAAGALCALRLLRRTSVPNQIVALDLLLVVIVMGIGILAFQTATDFFLDLLVVVSLLGFVGTITVARFVERRST